LVADRLRATFRPRARVATPFALDRALFALDRALFAEEAFLALRAAVLRPPRAAFTPPWTRFTVRRTARRAGAVRSTTVFAASIVALPNDCAVDVAELATLVAVSITVRVALPMMLPTTSADRVNESPVFCPVRSSAICHSFCCDPSIG
jgi:hypothetical protein